MIGSCFGKKFEGIWAPSLEQTMGEILLLKEAYEQNQPIEAHEHTGNIILATALTHSLIQVNDLDLEHMAVQLQASLICNAARNYGTGAISVCNRFKALIANNQLKQNCLMPASELFDHRGSYGCGAALRTFPLVLFTYYKPLEEACLACELVSRLTHSNVWAIRGAQVMCFGLREALNNMRPAGEFDFDSFFLRLIEFTNTMETTSNESSRPQTSSFSPNMQTTLRLYAAQRAHMLNAVDTDAMFYFSTFLIQVYKLVKRCRGGLKISTSRLQRKLAKLGVPAIESCLLALFAFVMANDPKCGHELNRKLNVVDAHAQFDAFERVIFYSLALAGEETTSVCTMACTITGAFYGRHEVPDYLLEACESHDKVKEQSTSLFKISVANWKFISVGGSTEWESKVYSQRVVVVVAVVEWWKWALYIFLVL